jgi:hypothetical protein
MLQAQYGDADSAERAKLTAFLLDLTQFLMVGRLIRESRSLLGPHAAYHKLRSVARQQSAVTAVEWQSLAAQAETNIFLHQRTQGIPEKVLLPDGVSLMLPEVAPAALGKVHRQRAETPGIAYVPLLEARSRRDVALRVSAMVGFSEHGLPTLGGPEKGFTARCVMRNVRDERIRGLARAEEHAAGEVATHRCGKKTDKSEATDAADATAAFAAAFTKVYDASARPHLIRIFVRFDGMFRIRLLLSDRRQRGRYAWGAALSRLLAESDIEVFLATLHENGQKTPRRTF